MRERRRRDRTTPLLLWWAGGTAVGALTGWWAALSGAGPGVVAVLVAVGGGVATGVAARRATRSSEEVADALRRSEEAVGLATTAVEEERDLLRAVLGALPQGALLVSPDDRIVVAGPAAAQVLGSVPDRAGSLVPRMVHRAVRDARAAGHPVRVRAEHGAPPRLLEATATPLDGDRGVMLVVEDVTDRSRVEAMRRDFVADASHELKTPVSAITASIEALEMALTQDPERAGEFSARALDSARQLARIIEDLLDLSRLEVSDLPTEEVPLHDLVQAEAEALAARAHPGVDVRWRVEPATVQGSARDLALAVRNLADNARRFTDPGGTIELTTRVDDGDVVVSVADTGTGIPSRALGRVFERFYRVDEARSRATGGTGLGLAIVRHVCERHGGTVSVQSQLGAGSTFTMRLPRSSSEG